MKPPARKPGFTDTELMNALDSLAIGVWELDGGCGWICEMGIGVSGDGDTPRAAIVNALRKMARLTPPKGKNK